MNPMQIFNSYLNMGTNPQQIEQMILNQNPNLKIVLNQMRQNRMTPVQYAIQYAKQNNLPISEQQINSMYQQMLSMIPKR